MPKSKTLFPGYKHVSAFADDTEYESGEEVSYLTLDVGNVEPTLVPSSDVYRLIGLDTPTPMLQLSGTIFQGECISLLGSEILFTRGPSVPSQPALSIGSEAGESASDMPPSHQTRLQFISSTSQRIRFKEVQLKPKQAGLSQAADAPAMQEASPNALYSKKSDSKVGKRKASGSGSGHKIKGRGSQRRQQLKGKERENVEANPLPDISVPDGDLMDLGEV